MGRRPKAAEIREQIVAEARDWRETPFIPQARQKHVGCDCKGLVVGVGVAVGLREAGGLYAGMSHYDIGAIDSALLKRGIAETLTEVAPEDALPGDLMLCRYLGVPAHLAWLTELPATPLGAPGRIEGGLAVHAQIVSRAHVKETALRVLFHFYPLDSVWRFEACR